MRRDASDDARLLPLPPADFRQRQSANESAIGTEFRNVVILDRCPKPPTTGTALKRGHRRREGVTVEIRHQKLVRGLDPLRAFDDNGDSAAHVSLPLRLAL